jgi:hypothetical protein
MSSDVAGALRVNRVISSDAPPRPLFTQLQTYRCVAANRRFGPILLKNLLVETVKAD